MGILDCTGLSCRAGQVAWVDPDYGFLGVPAVLGPQDGDLLEHALLER